MKSNLILLIGSLLMAGCQSKEWHFEKEILLSNIYPIGIDYIQNQLWIADGESNRVLKINTDGKILDTIVNLDRPMHIAIDNEHLFIPQFGNDSIVKYNFKNKHSSILSTPHLDAPAGISVKEDQIAIADFYHHSVHFYNGNQWSTYGKKGINNLEFNYPTDVQITPKHLYIADAYNHRIQILSKEGAHIQTLGESFEMNASTGLFIDKNDIYITDFENNRVFVTNREGEKIQTIKETIEEPTDIIVFDGNLWVLNFKKGSISVFSR